MRNGRVPLPLADGDGEDVVACIVLLCRRDRRQIARQAFPIEAPFKYLGVAHGPVRPIRVVHAVQRERDRVEIAFRHNARRVDKVLVVRAARHLRAVEVGRQPQRLQVGVDDRVRLRQQPRGLRRSRLSQHQHHRQRNHQRQHQQQRVASAPTHQEPHLSHQRHGRSGKVSA